MTALVEACRHQKSSSGQHPQAVARGSSSAPTRPSANGGQEMKAREGELQGSSSHIFHTRHDGNSLLCWLGQLRAS